MGRLLLLMLLCSASAAHGELYRWTDAQGRVHYTDKIPAEHQHRGHAELNKQGVVIDNVSASLTPEQQQHLIEQKRLKALRQQFDEQRQGRDQRLLERYDSEDDLVMTRDGKAAKLEQSLRISKGKADKARQALQQLEQRIASLQAQGKSVPVDTIQKLLRLRHGIKQLDAEIADEELQKAQLLAAYDRELLRYRHLKEPHKYAPPPAAADEAQLPDGVVACAAAPECASMWQRASAYLKRHAETPLKYQAEEIIMTAPALHDRQSSLVLSLIDDPSSGGRLIFLDPHCRQTAEGKSYCEGDKVREVMRRFSQAVVSETAPEPAPSSTPPAR
jgi:hypothetical protein